MGSCDAAARQRLWSRDGAAQPLAAAREGAWAVLDARAAQSRAALSLIVLCDSFESFFLLLIAVVARYEPQSVVGSGHAPILIRINRRIGSCPDYSAA